MNKSLWTVLVVVLCLVAVQTSAHCMRNDDENKDRAATSGDSATSPAKPEDDSSDDGVKGFFKNIGCEIVHGSKIVRDSVINASKTVKDGVTTGYRFVKSKLTPSEKAEAAAVNEDAVKPVVSSSQTLAANEDGEEMPVWDIDLRADFQNHTEIEDDNSTTLDNRHLLDAPILCPAGQMKDRMGRCRAAVG